MKFQVSLVAPQLRWPHSRTKLDVAQGPITYAEGVTAGSPGLQCEAGYPGFKSSCSSSRVGGVLSTSCASVGGGFPVSPFRLRGGFTVPPWQHRRADCHPRPSQNRTSGFPTSGSSVCPSGPTPSNGTKIVEDPHRWPFHPVESMEKPLPGVAASLASSVQPLQQQLHILVSVGTAHRSVVGDGVILQVARQF